MRTTGLPGGGGASRGTATALGIGAPRRRWRDHPLAPVAGTSWAALGIYCLVLAPIDGLEWLPRPGSLAWAPRAAAALWLAATAGLTAWILRRLRGSGTALERPGGPSWNGASLLGDAFLRLRKNQAALMAAGLLAILISLCAAQKAWYGAEADPMRQGPGAAGSPMPSEDSFFALHIDHTRVNKGESLRPPDTRHWFGTDALGRDIFARVLRGGIVSFSVGLVATLVSLLIGVTWGAVAGYLGGRTDHYLMRVVDVLYGLPFLFLVILILTLVNGLHQAAAKAGPVLERMEALERSGDREAAVRLAAAEDIGPVSSARLAVLLDRNVDPLIAMFAALGLVQWLTMARIVRGQVLSLKEREFVAAARVSGARAPRIILRHIVPNLLGPVIVDATLTVPAVMLSEAFLSFLGLGVGEPDCSWGSLAARGLAGVNMLRPCWWLIAYPAGAISLALFSLNFLGDGLRDALDPRSRRMS